MNSRTRFSVLARDNFTCMYCGRRPPDVALEIDHAISLNNGGNDTIDNYVTACEDCNKGKSSSNHIIEFETDGDELLYVFKKYLAYGELVNTIETLRSSLKIKYTELFRSILPGMSLIDIKTGEAHCYATDDPEQVSYVIDSATGEIAPTRFDEKEGR
jgi:hypothetical protein